MRLSLALRVGAVMGLLISCGILALFWFGVAGVLRVGHTDLTHLLWPSSVMLVGGWRSTVPGVMITVSSVAINCLLYAAVVFVLGSIAGAVLRLNPARD
jgi:hypothetical protein